MAVQESELFFGAYPVDFILETVIKEGLASFRNDSENAPNLIFGHLAASYLQTDYGQKKIDEISKFIRETKIPVVQHFSLVDVSVPCFSIQLLDGKEDESYAGLGDFNQRLTTLNSDETAVIDIQELLYASISDTIQIGIHTAITPDLTKYLYYFLVNLFITKKQVFINRGLQLTSWSATDISRLNEWLPNNIYSRFVNFSVFTTPKFNTGISEEIITDIDISADPDDTGGIITPVE